MANQPFNDETGSSSETGAAFSRMGKPDVRFPVIIAAGVIFIAFVILMDMIIWPASPLHRSLFASAATATATVLPSPQGSLETPTQAAATLAFSQVVTATLSVTSTQVITPTASYPQQKSADGMVMVKVQDFWLDQTEVTNAMYAQCVTAGRCDLPAPNTLKVQGGYYKDVKFANYPVIFVNGKQAKAYCQWLGKSLPSHAQWLKAVGPGPFPWGKINPNDKHANYCAGKCQKLVNIIAGSAGNVKPVGSYPDGISPFGALDLAGNVYEWWLDNGFYSYGGGSWSTPAKFLEMGASPIQAPNFAAIWRGDLGFRCMQSQ